MTIARFKSGLGYEIKMRCLMCIYYLEDIWYALETVIQLEWFVKFKKKSMIFKPKYNAEMPRLVMQKPNHLPKLYWSALTHTVFFWGSWCKSVRIGPIRSVWLAGCIFLACPKPTKPAYVSRGSYGMKEIGWHLGIQSEAFNVKKTH